MKKRKIIIDCDPGIDDAFAITIALRDPSFDVLGIHTVSGNVSVENTTRNAQGLLYLLGSDVPVHMGSSEPLVIEPIYASDVHGANGFSEYKFDDDKLSPLSCLSSIDAYKKVLSESNERVTIIAMGPLTNIAILLKSYPELKKKIECISLMGGGIKGGNVTVAGEFNFYADPHSAAIVFNSGVDIVMAGLDVTEAAKIYKEDIEEIKNKGGELGLCLHEIYQNLLNKNFSEGNGYTATPHDSVAVLCLLHPELFEGRDLFVEIDFSEGRTRGMSIADVRKSPASHCNAHVLLNVNKDEFRKVFIKKVLGY
ncbi:MAG: nucleoside hydrolase [Erysipelotrichaceae bacterium]